MHTDARFRIAVEAAPNGMIMIDRDVSGPADPAGSGT